MSALAGRFDFAAVFSVVTRFLGARLVGAGLGRGKTAAQRIHEIHDIALHDGRLGLGHPLAGRLGLDQFAQGLLVAIDELRGLEAAFLALHDGAGDLDHLGIDLHLGKIIFGRTHLVGGAQEEHHQPRAARLDQHGMLAARHHDAPHRGLLLLGHGFGDHAISLETGLLRVDVIGRIDIDRIDRGAIDEGLEIQDAGGFDLQLLQFRRLEDDVLVALRACSP